MDSEKEYSRAFLIIISPHEKVDSESVKDNCFIDSMN